MMGEPMCSKRPVFLLSEDGVAFAFLNPEAVARRLISRALRLPLDMKPQWAGSK